MKELFKTTFFKITLVISALVLLQSCTAYSTNLNEAEKFQISAMEEIKQGEACTNNLFGGFSLPYFGDTAIRLRGDESVIAAIKNANINSIYAVDRRVNNYIFYSKRCTIVFGRQKIEVVKDLKVGDIPVIVTPDSTNSTSPSTTVSPVVPTVPTAPGI